MCWDLPKKLPSPKSSEVFSYFDYAFEQGPSIYSVSRPLLRFSIRVSRRFAAVCGLYTSIIKRCALCLISSRAWSWLSNHSTLRQRSSRAAVSGLSKLDDNAGLRNEKPVLPFSIRYGVLPMSLLETSTQPFAILSLATAPHPSLRSEVKRNISCCAQHHQYRVFLPVQ